MTNALLATIMLLTLTGVACGGAGAGASGGASGGDCTHENATQLTGTLTIKGSFSSNCFSAASGSTISISNEDFRTHTFTVRDTDIDVTLPVGDTGQATAPAPGTYDFLCTIHPGMTGTIIVT